MTPAAAKFALRSIARRHRQLAAEIKAIVGPMPHSIAQSSSGYVTMSAPGGTWSVVWARG